MLHTPLHVLTVAPRPVDLDPAPSLDRLDGLYDALEAQGDLVEIEWLWPPTCDALSERLSDDLAPQIDVLCLDAPMMGDPVFERADGASERMLGSALAELVGASQVALLVAIAAPSDEPNWVSHLSARTQTHLLLLHPDLAQHAVCQVASAFFTALVSGQSLEGALAQSLVAMGDSGRDPLRLSARGTERPPSELVALHLAGADAALVEISSASVASAGPSVRSAGDDAEPTWLPIAELPGPGGLPAEAQVGFVGRARELRALERALDDTASARPIWVHGYGGVGKTALVCHLARWLVRTGRFGQVVYTDLGGGAMPEEALYDLGRRLVGEAFVLSDSDALARIQAALASQSTLIIWDGVEGILGDAEYPLSREGLAELWELARQFAQTGDSRVCLLSDTSTLPPEARQIGELALALDVGPMHKEDAVALLGRIWDLAGLGVPPLPVASDVATSLGGHPLALQALSTAAGGRGFSEALAQLDEILPGWRSGDGTLRNQGLEACLELLLRGWDADTRGQLARLGGLRKGFMEPLGQRVMGLEANPWANAKKRLEASRLLSPQVLPGFTVPYIQMHPAFEAFLRRRLGASQLALLEAAVLGNYGGLVQWLVDAESRSPAFSRAMGRRELPNLRHVLAGLLSQDQLTVATTFLRNLTRLLSGLGFVGETQRAAGAVDAAIRAALPEEGPLGHAGVRFLLDRGEQLAEAGQLQQALGLLQQLVQRMTQEKGLSYSGDQATLDRALAFHRLGRAMRSLGRPDAVLGAYAQAQDLLSTVAISDASRRQRLDLLQDMAEVALVANQIAEAQRHAERGLDLALQMEDHHALGILHRHMGVIRAASQEWKEARHHLEAALAEFVLLEDGENQISVREQMGGLELQQGDLEAAERQYSQAMTVARASELPQAEAQLLRQIAQVREGAGRPGEAMADLEAAIDIYAHHKQAAAQAGAQVQLAELLLRLGRPDGARPHAEAARVLVESLGPGAQAWSVYALLQRITLAQGDSGAADRWRVRAQHAFAGSPAADAVRERWGALIQSVAASCRGAALDLETVQAVEQLETNDQWAGLAAALWRVLGGERGPDLYEKLDHIDATIVRAIVDAIESPPPDQLEPQSE